MEIPHHVAIIGAGLSGLSFALALHKVNIHCEIYEARPASYDLGGGIMLSPNALRILDRLGVYERVKDKGFHFDKLYFCNGDGRVQDVYYFGSKELYGYRGFRIIRKLLINELRLMLDEAGVPIHFNQGLTKVISESADGVEFELFDGRIASTSILVGADGIHSTVRRYIHAELQPIYSGFTGINCVCRWADMHMPADFPLPATIMCDAGAFIMAPQEVDGSQVFIGVQSRTPEKTREGWEAMAADKQGLFDELTKNNAQWPPIVQAAMNAARPENAGMWAFYGIPKVTKWASEKERVIMLGDAAHAIPPTTGQGANQAFEDVNMLATLLSNLSPQVPLSAALRFWQEYRQVRLDKILDLTKQMNAKRLPAAEQAKLPPGTIWSDESATRGEGGQLRWLYEPDLDQDVASWIAARRT